MTYKILFAITIICFVCLHCFGQQPPDSTLTSVRQGTYQGLTPGQSTKTDVERALGQPASQVTERLLEYRSDGKQIYVQYSKDSPTAIRIQLILNPPAPRAEILARERLPRLADIRRPNKKGQLEEYFANPHYIVLTYEGNSPTQVSQVGYYSRQLFEGVTPELPGSPSASPATTPTTSGAGSRAVDIPSLNANVVSLRFYVTPLTTESREYRTRFAKSETRRIGYELVLRHPAPGHRIEYSIESVWQHDGAVFHTHKFDTWIEPDWIQSTPVYALGWDEPGTWPIGSYLVELVIDGRKIATGSFEVY